MRLGFSGTQKGMTPAQKAAVKKIVIDLAPSEVHHGDCVGADYEFHQIVKEVERELGIEIRKVGHPPVKQSRRAFCDFDEECEPRDYLDRNTDIAFDTDALLAAPKADVETQRSGTWSTVRRARSKGNPIFVVPPDGNVMTEGFR